MTIFKVCDTQSVLALLKKQQERAENFRPEWESKRPQKFVQSAIQMQEFHVLFLLMFMPRDSRMRGLRNSSC